MKFIFVIIIQVVIICHIYSQINVNEFNIKKNEVYFSFNINDLKIPIKSLSNQISIEKIRGDIAYAYSNTEKFNMLKSRIENVKIITSEFELRNIPMANSLKDVMSWNYYPTFSQYEQLISSFIDSFPDICSKEIIGKSVNGRNIWALKISDNVENKEAEPEFLYSASIHGNEPLGYVLLLRLTDYLLSNYNSDIEIKELIDNHEIWIIPISNPDGTYAGGDNTLNGATRFNANGLDLNRNFPDPENGQHPDGKDWQPENIAFMNFVKDHNFTVSANLHTGMEVVNYPWDTWSKLHTDDTWLRFISRQFADTIHTHSPIGYFDDFNNGITNGFEWYTISGGIQDYMTYFENSRNLTIEMSSVHLVDTALLSNFWEYNYRSLLNLIKSCDLGISGIVGDSLTGNPLKAKIEIVAHDFDNSFVYSDSLNGDFYRPISTGNYSVLISVPDYYSKQIDNVYLLDNDKKVLDVKLLPIQDNTDSCNGSFYANIFLNPVNDILKINILSSMSDVVNVRIINTLGGDVFSENYNSTCNSKISINVNNLKNGVYYIVLRQNNIKIVNKIVKI